MLKRVLVNLTNPAFIAGFVALAALIFSHWLMPKDYRRPSYFIAPPNGIEHFTFGYQEVMADFLWLRAIQDFDYCEKPLANNLCLGQSWLYKILDKVSDLSPKFRMVMATGPVALSIIVSDIDGASKLFDKAVQRFPKDWSILGRAAYHALYEENDKGKAAQLLKLAGENGGPAWYYNLSGRLLLEDGQVELGEALLKELTEAGQPEEVLTRLREKIESHRKAYKKTQKK